MSFLILCPFVHHPTFIGMWETLDPELREGALVIDNTVKNLGAAGSRNVGARRILEEGIDWLVDISPVTRFGPPGGRDFVEQLPDASRVWVLQSAAPVNWHLVSWSRFMFETIGLFDENCWPIYTEDLDISHRIHTYQSEHPNEGIWDCVESDAWVTMYGHSQRVAGIYADQPKLQAYIVSKWGVMGGSEMFTHPFNDPALPLSFWPEPPDPRSIITHER